MRQLQKGNQAAQRIDCRRNWLSRVLILRTLRKTDHRVPEETQASPAQDDRIAAPSDSFTQRWTAADGVFFRLASFPQRRAPVQRLQIAKASQSRLANFLYLPPALHLDRTRNPAHFP